MRGRNSVQVCRDDVRANNGEVSESKGKYNATRRGLIAALFGSKVLRLSGAREHSELARGTAQSNLGGGSLRGPTATTTPTLAATRTPTPERPSGHDRQCD